MRKVSEDLSVKALRLMVVTDRGQIYHNNPSRKINCDGISEAFDLKRFEESVVWDLPGRLYPSNKADCETFERYYPGLPKDAYAYYPEVSAGKVTVYGNSGFKAVYEGNGEKRSRFYIARREPEGNPFYYMSGFQTDYKISVIGTYRSNTAVGVRTCIFMSDDGGRQWFCQYEFGDLGEYLFHQGKREWGRNFGNCIHLNTDGYKRDVEIFLRKRECIIPGADDKEPMHKFRWKDITVFDSYSQGNTLILESKEPHNLTTGNIVTIASAPAELAWMTNSRVDSDSCGNGLLFKVETIDVNTIKLYEFVAAPDNPIPCRHIHHINRVRDGWLIGTGEIYPNAWLMYIQMKEADSFAEKNASDQFDIFRLNSTGLSVQRTLGVIWMDDGNDTVLYASDHDVLDGKTEKCPIPDRSLSISRNATGVYIGKLEDIDDYNKFSLVYEAVEPAYLLQQYDSAIVFSGQRGETALSFDNGKTWKSVHIDGALNHPKGGTFQYHLFDDYLLHIKR